jgi:hypothetical protein
MMVNSSQPGEGGGCTPSPFHSMVYGPAEKADTLLLFLLYPFVLCGLFVGFNTSLPFPSAGEGKHIPATQGNKSVREIVKIVRYSCCFPVTWGGGLEPISTKGPWAWFYLCPPSTLYSVHVQYAHIQLNDTGDICSPA